MKIKPGIVRPAIVKPGHTTGWTFTVVVEVGESKAELASLTNYRNTTDAKKGMREFITNVESWSRPTVPANRTPEMCEYCEGNCPNDEEYCCDEYSADGFNDNLSYSDVARDGRWE